MINLESSDDKIRLYIFDELVKNTFGEGVHLMQEFSIANMSSTQHSFVYDNSDIEIIIKLTYKNTDIMMKHINQEILKQYEKYGTFTS